METEILRVRHVEPAEARARGRECKTPRPPKTGSIDNVSSRQGEKPLQRKGLSGPPDRPLQRHAPDQLHEFHELVFGIVHDLSRDRGGSAFFRQPLDLLTGHRTDEIRNVIEALLRFRRPGHAVG